MNRNRTIKRLAAAFSCAAFASGALSGCSPFGGSASETADVPEASNKLSVVTTIFPQYDFSRAVAGDLAEVTMLLSPGQECHTYEPTPQDIITIQNADIFIYAGGESESWVDGILGSFDTSDMQIINMIELVDAVEEEVVEGMEAEDEDGHDEGGELDEHVWASIDNAQIISEAISDALCKADPENENTYRQNCERYLEELSGVKKDISKVIAGAKRKTIVFGDRFPARYFTDEFGLEYYAAFPGCAEQSEPSAGTVAFLIDKIKNENIPVVFYIELSNGKVAQTIAESTGAETMLFNSCHNVTMEQFLDGVTYIDLMKQNCEALKKALY